MAESVADKVKDVLKAQEHIQEFWNTFKNKNRKKWQTSFILGDFR